MDYGCPERAADWVETNFPQVKVVRVTDDPDFCLARARNIGAASATADWLVFIDADIITSEGWMDWMVGNIEPGNFYLAAKVDGGTDGQTAGTVICPRSDFETIGGYDEIIRGWGGEDGDLYRRLDHVGVHRGEYPKSYVTAIRHGHDLRAGPEGLKSLSDKMLFDYCYTALKLQIIAITGSPVVSTKTRLHLRAQLRNLVSTWTDTDSKKPLIIKYRYPIGMDTNIHQYVIDEVITFTLKVSRNTNFIVIQSGRNRSQEIKSS